MIFQFYHNIILQYYKMRLVEKRGPNPSPPLPSRDFVGFLLPDFDMIIHMVQLIFSSLHFPKCLDLYSPFLSFIDSRNQVFATYSNLLITIFTTVKPLITNTSEEFIKCRLDNCSMSFLLYYVNFSICENK